MHRFVVDNFLKEHFEKSFIYHTYACIKNRGMLTDKKLLWLLQEIIYSNCTQEEKEMMLNFNTGKNNTRWS